MVAQVLLLSRRHAVDRAFDYEIPPELAEQVKIGMRVLVPFGLYNNTVEALVTGINHASDVLRLKKIKSIIGTEPVAVSYTHLDVYKRQVKL